eukprot:1156011-Pelagomonas_calceolata.AAC.2
MLSIPRVGRVRGAWEFRLRHRRDWLLYDREGESALGLGTFQISSKDIISAARTGPGTVGTGCCGTVQKMGAYWALAGFKPAAGTSNQQQGQAEALKGLAVVQPR